MTDSVSLVVQLRQALAALDAAEEATPGLVSVADVLALARAVLVHLEGEPDRLAKVWTEGRHSPLYGPVQNPYRREEQANG